MAKIIYGNVTEKDVPALLDAISSGKPLEELAVGRVDSEKHPFVGKIDYAYKKDAGTADTVKPCSKLDYIKKQHKVI